MKKMLIFLISAMTIVPLTASTSPITTKKIVVDLKHRVGYVLERDKISDTVGTWRLIRTEPIIGGRPGYRTSPGKYTIYLKKKNHVSSKFPIRNIRGKIVRGGSSMPNSLFLQKVNGCKTGFAFHYSGINGLKVPSHGCIHVGLEFSQWLYDWAEVGTKVEIYQKINKKKIVAEAKSKKIFGLF